MSISADGYEDLRAAIVSGDVLPGERLPEQELRARLGIGRTQPFEASAASAGQD